MSDDKVQKPPVLIDADDAAWFDRHYPSHGSWSWFIRESLKAFRALHGKETPDDLMKLGAQELLRRKGEG